MYWLSLRNALGALAGLSLASSTVAQFGIDPASSSSLQLVDVSTEISVGTAALSDLFEFHVLRSGISETEALAQMETATERFIELASQVVGPGEVRARFLDLADQNPLTPGKIPFFWIDGVHPHNINVGTPYTGIVVASSPGGNAAPGSEILLHELGHLFFGKFNDGLAEPIANMFRKQDSRRQLLGNLAVTRDVLERARGGDLQGGFDLRSMMSYRPSATVHLCNVYREAQAGGDEAAFLAAQDHSLRSTVNSLEGLAMESGGSLPASLAAHIAATPAPSGNVGRLDAPNPNETRGPVREVFGTVGDTLQAFLIQQVGMDGYLRFYYSPTDQTLASLGLQDFTGLEEALSAWITAELDPVPEVPVLGEAIPWFLSQQPGGTPESGIDCLLQANWQKPECDSSRPKPQDGNSSQPAPVAGSAASGPGRDGPARGGAGQAGPSQGGPGQAGPSRSGPAPVRPANFLPASQWRERLVQNFEVPGDGTVAAVRVTEELGVAFDIARYCSQDRVATSPAVQ